MAMQIKKSEDPYFPKRKPEKSADYLKWLHELPCVVSRQYGVEAAHVSFAEPMYCHYGRAKGHKASDRWALPLAPDLHLIQHKGSEREFWKQVGINPHIVALVLWGLWSEMGDDATEAATAVIMEGRIGR